MDIILIRHGESESNIDKTYGGPETLLSPRGIKQARITQPYLDHLKQKRIMVSPYKRAVDTMDRLGLVGDVVDDIREVDFGILEGRTYKEFYRDHRQIAEAWNEDPIYYRLPEGESLHEAYGRVAIFLDGLIEQDEDTVLICHDGIIRLALCYVFDQVEYFYRFKADNLSLTKISIDEGYKYIGYQNRIYY